MQERFRVYIEERLGKHFATYDRVRDEAPAPEAAEELQSLGSIVLLFRTSWTQPVGSRRTLMLPGKLREGVVASHRVDEFAIEGELAWYMGTQLH